MTTTASKTTTVDAAAHASIGAAARRINDAKFARLKRLTELNIDAVPGIAPATLGHLATASQASPHLLGYHDIARLSELLLWDRPR